MAGGRRLPGSLPGGDDGREHSWSHRAGCGSGVPQNAHVTEADPQGSLWAVAELQEVAWRGLLVTQGCALEGAPGPSCSPSGVLCHCALSPWWAALHGPKPWGHLCRWPQCLASASAWPWLWGGGTPCHGHWGGWDCAVKPASAPCPLRGFSPQQGGFAIRWEVLPSAVMLGSASDATFPLPQLRLSRRCPGRPGPSTPQPGLSRAPTPHPHGNLWPGKRR